MTHCDALWVGSMGKKVNGVLDADIRGFFDTITHGWLVKFLEHRVADRRLLRLIQQWLRAGVSEHGQWSRTNVGTPQGAVASPLLANVYLPYVFDLWVQQWRTKWNSKCNSSISMHETFRNSTCLRCCQHPWSSGLRSGA